MLDKMIERYFAYARERQKVMLAKAAGRPRPWTPDPILQNYRFCNIFREDDTVTQWVKKNIRDPLDEHEAIVYAMVVARFFNTIPTLDIVAQQGLLTGWDPDHMRSVLAGRKPLITAAYMVKTPLRKPKLEGLLEIFEPVWHDRLRIRAKIEGKPLQYAHEELMKYRWIGGFMAYEVVSDLRHTSLLRNAPDIMTWANAGPGATRGVMRLISGLPDGNTTETTKQSVMQELVRLSRDPGLWPADWPSWEMREAEHVLCEFDKYERARLNEGAPKQRYNGHGNI